MESYSPIIVLIVNVLRTLLVKKAMDIFLSLDDVEKKSRSGCILHVDNNRVQYVSGVCGI